MFTILPFKVYIYLKGDSRFWCGIFIIPILPFKVYNLFKRKIKRCSFFIAQNNAIFKPPLHTILAKINGSICIKSHSFFSILEAKFLRRDEKSFC
jgi:hypothetical protein